MGTATYNREKALEMNKKNHLDGIMIGRALWKSLDFNVVKVYLIMIFT
jgi:tRNA-dihydrouridine synthase